MHPEPEQQARLSRDIVGDPFAHLRDALARLPCLPGRIDELHPGRGGVAG